MAWFDSNWTYRLKVTIDNTKVPGDLTDFPVAVDLSDIGTSHGFWSNVKSDGGDIRVCKSDGDTRVACEMYTIDTGAETGEIYFTTDGTLSSSSDTDFYIYYGNASATKPSDSDTYGTYNVWDSDFTGVYHLGDASAEDVVSSTSQQVNEDDPASSSATSTSGILGDGFDFNNSSNNIIFESGVSTHLCPTSALTFEVWFNADTKSNDVLLYCRGDSTSKGYGLWFWNSYLRPSIGINGNPWTNLTYAMSNINTNTWYYGAATWDGSTAKLYVDGDEKDSYSISGSISYFGSQMTFGTRASGDDFDGTLDEIRLSQVGRSANWLLTTENNIRSPGTFYTIGSEETDTAGGATYVPKVIMV